MQLSLGLHCTSFLRMFFFLLPVIEIKVVIFHVVYPCQDFLFQIAIIMENYSRKSGVFIMLKSFNHKIYIHTQHNQLSRDHWLTHQKGVSMRIPNPIVACSCMYA